MIFASAIHEDSKRIFHIDRDNGIAFPIDDVDSMQEWIACFNENQPLVSIREQNGVSLDDLVWASPVENPEKIICVGRNYAEHAEEMGAAVGEVPVIFSKFASALTGHNQSVELPSISQSVDYEAELVVVIGQEAKNVTREDAMNYVFGFTCGNDVSARDWQKGKPGGQWLLGKTFDSFAPVGPWIVTADSVSDHTQLDIHLRLNGRTMQSSNTSQLIFGVPFLISHLSQFMTLRPGDLIFTGTPPGVGSAREPQVFLKNGDIMEVEIGEIGILKNRVSSAC